MTSPLVNNFQGKSRLSSAEFLTVFKTFDKDGNGFIEKKELDSFLSELIKEKSLQTGNIGHEELKKIVLDKYDQNHDGKISMDELANILPTEDNFLLHFRDSTTIHIADFMKIWYHYDSDKSGFLESNELKVFLRDLLGGDDTSVTTQRIDDYAATLLDLFDKNKDGKIELSELSKILPVEENFLNKFQSEVKLSKDEFIRLFQHYDQDNNGYIEDTELMGFLKDLLEHKDQEPTTTDLEQYRTCIMEISDHDKDGKLSKEELEMLLLGKVN